MTTGRPLVFEPYAANRTTGSFILIDPTTNFTAGAGMIVAALHGTRERASAPGAAPSGFAAGGARQAASESDADRRPSVRCSRRSWRFTSMPRLALVAAGSRSGGRAMRHGELPGGMRRARAHAARGASAHPGPVPRYRPSFRGDASLPRRDRSGVGPQPGHSARHRSRCRGSGARIRRPAARATRSSRCSRRRPATTRGSRAFAATRPLPAARGARRSGAGSPSAAGATLHSKVSPLARWTTKEVWRYAKRHGIPLLPPATEAGYTSVGCEPCTTLPVDTGNERSGRWGGQKLECGIHIQPTGT